MPAENSHTGFCFAFRVEQIAGKGRAVVALEPIRKGSIVWRHQPGLYEVHDEQSFTALIDGMSRAEVIYELEHCFGLADFPGCVLRILDEGALINHATPPNLVTNNAQPLAAPWDAETPDYIDQVTQALLGDRYALVATRDIDVGEEFSNDYLSECAEPAFYDALCEAYGVDDSYLE